MTGVILAIAGFAGFLLITWLAYRQFSVVYDRVEAERHAEQMRPRLPASGGFIGSEGRPGDS